MKWRRLGAAVMLLLLVSGCWDNREPRRRAFVLGLGIDRSEKNPEHFAVTVQIPVPRGERTGGQGGASSGGGRQGQYYLVQGEGSTVMESLERIQDRVSRELYYGHMRSLVISSELSVEQWHRAADEVRRNPDIEETVYMVVARGRADQIIRVDTGQERLPALYFNTIFESISRMSHWHPVRIWEFWRAQEAEGQEAVIPVVSQASPAELRLAGMAVFRGYELRGFLDGEAVRGYLWLMGRTNATSFPVEVEGVSGAVRSLRVGRSVQVSFQENKPVFRVHMKVSGELALLEYPQSADEETIRKLEQATGARIQGQVKAALAKLQGEFGSDVLGFGKQLYYRQPAYFDAVSWQKVFPQVRIETTVQVNLRRKGAHY